MMLFILFLFVLCVACDPLPGGNEFRWTNGDHFFDDFHPWNEPKALSSSNPWHVGGQDHWRETPGNHGLNGQYCRDPNDCTKPHGQYKIPFPADRKRQQMVTIHYPGPYQRPQRFSAYKTTADLESTKEKDQTERVE